MRRRFGTIAALATVVALQGGSAQAVTYGRPDNGEHPNVGALMAEWREEGVKEQLCSGTLIDEDVFLTAAHCTAFLESIGIGPDEVWVSFADDVDPLDESTLVSGTYVTNPRYNQRQSDPADLAVVLLDADQTMDPAELPRVGLFTRMNRQNRLERQKFTAVGYGDQEPERGGGPPTFPNDGRRWQSVPEFRALNKVWLRLSQNQATGDSGTCFGDSGGPNFLGAGRNETDIVASVTVTGDAMCVATNVTYRLDTRQAHGFIDPFLD